MADAHAPERPLANGQTRIDFQTEPSRYRHWKLDDRRRGRDASARRRREGRAVRGLRSQAQFLRSRRRHRTRRRHRAAAFRASASARRGAALGQAAGVLRRRQYPHAGRREPRPQSQFLQIHQRDAQRHRGFERKFRAATICAINGTAAGGGYELALAADYIMLVDDGSSSVSLPELPLLAVLPGTGGLTRVSDKRKVRRDHADCFLHHRRGREGQARASSGGWSMKSCRAPNSRTMVAARAT